jgi:hypothetical protein
MDVSCKLHSQPLLLLLAVRLPLLQAVLLGLQLVLLWVLRGERTLPHAQEAS